jgi:hypothetical protein
LYDNFAAGQIPSAQDFQNLIDSTYSVGLTALSGTISTSIPAILNGMTFSNFATSSTAISGVENRSYVPIGYFTVTLNGSAVKIPYFN